MDLWEQRKESHPLAIRSEKQIGLPVGLELPLETRSLLSLIEQTASSYYYSTVCLCGFVCVPMCMCLCEWQCVECLALFSLGFVELFRGEPFGVWFIVVVSRRGHIFLTTLLSSHFALVGLKWLKWWRSCLRRWSASIAISSCTRTIRCSRVSMTLPPPPAHCRPQPPAGTTPAPGTVSLRQQHPPTNGYPICIITIRVVPVSLPVQVCHSFNLLAYFIRCQSISIKFLDF